MGGGLHGLKAKAVLEDLEAAIKEDEAAYKDFEENLEIILLKASCNETYNVKIFKMSESAAAYNATLVFAANVGIPALHKLLTNFIKPLCSSLAQDAPHLHEKINGMMAAAGILLSSVGEVSGEMASTQAGKIAAEAVKGMEEGLVKQQAHQAALKAA